MKLAESRITGQGQVSVPAEVRRRLGLVPGSAIEWNTLESGEGGDSDEKGTAVVVRRARRHTSEAVHHILFPAAAEVPRRSHAQLKEGIREQMRRRAGH